MTRALLSALASGICTGVILFLLPLSQRQTGRPVQGKKEAAAEKIFTRPTLEIIPETEPTTEMSTEPTAPPPPAAMLEVPFYSQVNVLPTGCELVSAKMVLEYYTGSEISIEEIISHMTFDEPAVVEGKLVCSHPKDAFIGSPYDETSFGCFAPAIVTMMNQLLPQGFRAVETTGMPLNQLAETYIPSGTPVLVWATISMVESFPHMGWFLPDEKGKPSETWYDWLANEHCLVLVGYDEENYYFNDPLKKGAPWAYGRALAEKRYQEMGQYSLVVKS